jgi:predicted dehydrogenase
MEEIGVGIIGAGVRGVYCLGQAIVMLSGETKLFVSGVHDILKDRAEEARQYLEKLYSDRGQNRKIRVHQTYREMLEDEGCRIVLVTNFTSQHRASAVEALAAGKKVYLDKPISVTRQDALQIVDAARENPLIMGFTRRYEKSWIKAKDLLDSGIIGPLQMMQINSVIPYHRYLQTWHRRREL